MVALSKIDTLVSILSASSSEHLSEGGQRSNRDELRCRRHTLGKGVLGERKSLLCRYSSVVEHTLGKGGVVSPILTSGTIKKASLAEAFLMGVLKLETDLRGQRKSGADSW